MGREDKEEDYVAIPQPPPPSPISSNHKRAARPSKSSPPRKQKLLVTRSPGTLRKPLPVNRTYDLENREYTQYEIDHPECDSEPVVEQRVVWSKPQKAQSISIVEVLKDSPVAAQLQQGHELTCTSN